MLSAKKEKQLLETEMFGIQTQNQNLNEQQHLLTEKQCVQNKHLKSNNRP